MLTVRGSFLVGAAVYGFATALLLSMDALAAVCLAILVWIWIEWLCFEAMQISMQRFTDSIVREIDGQSDDKITLVADREYEVAYFADVNRLPRGYRVTLRDLVPDTFSSRGSAAAIIDSGIRLMGRHASRPRLRQIYEVETPICGRVEFPGIQLEISDHAGLFRTERFAPVPQILTVLPFLIRPQTTVSVLKHNNLQRHLGHHRHRSAGISSELHGIRDYQPGDPPRTIAWKPTARLGKMMTCEFENEVPIRATILVDLANYQFQGRPGPSAGDRAISTAASVAKLLLADRDPVAALLIDDREVKRVDHGSGERQMARLMQYLLRASNPHPPLDHFYFRDLLQVVFENASRRFPHLLDERYNAGRVRFSLIGKNASELRIRRALAVLLSHLLKLPYGSATQMQFDDVAMRKACLQYVKQFSVVSSSTTVAIDPPYRDFGQWLRARNKLTLKTCENLTRLRGRAKDNELFVIIAPEPHDLLGCEMIEASVKNAIAAQHRVIFVAPEQPVYDGHVQDPVAREILLQNTSITHRKAESSLGERLQAIGATFARIDDPRLMTMVAGEIGLLQSSASRSAGMRRAYR